MQALEGQSKDWGFIPSVNYLLLKGFEQGSEWHVLINILETFQQPRGE